MFDPLTSVPVNISEHATITERRQVRFPKSKKKRIRRKWEKRPGNFAEERVPGVLVVGGSVYVHPDCYDQFKRQFDSKD